MSDVHGPIWIINEKEQTYPARLSLQRDGLTDTRRKP